MAAINKAIRGNSSIFVGKYSLRAAAHLVKFNGLWLPVVYDKRLSCIVTVLPKQVEAQWMKDEDIQKEMKDERNGNVQTC